MCKLNKWFVAAGLALSTVFFAGAEQADAQYRGRYYGGRGGYRYAPRHYGYYRSYPRYYPRYNYYPRYYYPTPVYPTYPAYPVYPYPGYGYGRGFSFGFSWDDDD
jgi:hypothetical protein